MNEHEKKKWEQTKRDIQKEGRREGEKCSKEIVQTRTGSLSIPMMLTALVTINPEY